MNEQNSNKNKKKLNNYSNLMAFITFYALIMLFIAGITIMFFRYRGRVKRYLNSGKPVSLLLVGSDRGSRGRADTIMVITLNPKSRRVGLISIPRDLLINNKGIIYEKINGILSNKGISELRRYINELLGIKIQFYAMVSFESVTKIIDMIGGIDLYNDMKMEYRDNSANLNISIPVGLIHMDGQKTIEYLRYRSKKMGDIGRLYRHQEFIQLLIKNILQDMNLLRNTKLVKFFLKSVKSNIQFSDILTLMYNFKSLNIGDLEFMTVGGKTERVGDITFLRPEINTKQRIVDFIKTLEFEQAKISPGDIKVQVLNGSGIRGAAMRIRNKLIRNGFNVIEHGNADNQDYENTIILDRVGNIKMAKMVSDILNAKMVYPKLNRYILIDVTVIIGKDINR